MRLFRLWRVGKSDLGLLWFALRHPDRPVWLIPVAAVLAFYALEPVNFAIPFVGALDDLIIVPLVLHSLSKFLPTRVRADFGRAA